MTDIDTTFDNDTFGYMRPMRDDIIILGTFKSFGDEDVLPRRVIQHEFDEAYLIYRKLNPKNDFRIHEFSSRCI